MASSRIEQAIEPALTAGDRRQQLEQLRLGERPARAHDLEAAGREHVVVRAGRVLEAGWSRARSARPRSYGRPMPA
jgi:hypothetical protein